MSIDGIIVIDKPKDITSFKAVSIVKRYLNVKKVGHMGTLDPMATGVLPILIGKATKALDLTNNHNKKYIFEMEFGISTNTQDITGEIISKSGEKVKYSDIVNIVNEFKGEIFQIPPMYSAIKKDGIKLYELARMGKTVEREKRKIFISNIEIQAFDEEKQRATLIVACSRGTYIRSLCSDIGDRLGSGAVMTSLRRIESNGFNVDDSISLDKFRTLCNIGEIEKNIITIDNLFKDLTKVDVTFAQSIRFKNGGGLSLFRLDVPDNANEGMKFRVYYEDKFIGLGKIDLNKQELSVLKVLDADK